MSGSAPIIVITEKQQSVLSEFAASRTIAVSLAQRSKIILMAFDRIHNDEIAEAVGLNRNQVGVWRHRWKAAFYDLVAVECSEGIPALKQAITKPCGEQYSIRFLPPDLKPHRHKYWLFSPDRSTPEFDARVRLICDVYSEAIEAYNDYGIHTICMDEQTGIQALERIAMDLPCIAGQERRLEFEYIRHGTLCLFGNFHVATGRIINPFINETRTEADFLSNLKGVVQFDPKARFRIVLDNLNTHCSESCVRFVAEQCGVDTNSLGEKGRSGILKDRHSRQAFLSNPLHRIHFYFIPKHTSWMNQVEIWLGVVRRKVTRYGNFVSLENLRNKLRQFIGYYNDVLAHPYAWTYRGKPLCV